MPLHQFFEGIIRAATEGTENVLVYSDAEVHRHETSGGLAPQRSIPWRSSTKEQPHFFHFFLFFSRNAIAGSCRTEITQDEKSAGGGPRPTDKNGNKEQRDDHKEWSEVEWALVATKIVPALTEPRSHKKRKALIDCNLKKRLVFTFEEHE